VFRAIRLGVYLAIVVLGLWWLGNRFPITPAALACVGFTVIALWLLYMIFYNPNAK
jgi:hypothetical protein